MFVRSDEGISIPCIVDAIRAGVDGRQKTRAALIYGLRTASKAVAHLTYGKTKQTEKEKRKLVLACETVWRLTRDRVYAGDPGVDRWRHPGRKADAVLEFKKSLQLP